MHSCFCFITEKLQHSHLQSKDHLEKKKISSNVGGTNAAQVHTYNYDLDEIFNISHGRKICSDNKHSIRNDDVKLQFSVAHSYSNPCSNASDDVCNVHHVNLHEHDCSVDCMEKDKNAKSEDISCGKVMSSEHALFSDKVSQKFEENTIVMKKDYHFPIWVEDLTPQSISTDTYIHSMAQRQPSVLDIVCITSNILTHDLPITDKTSVMSHRSDEKFTSNGNPLGDKTEPSVISSKLSECRISQIHPHLMKHCRTVSTVSQYDVHGSVTTSTIPINVNMAKDVLISERYYDSVVPISNCDVGHPPDRWSYYDDMKHEGNASYECDINKYPSSSKPLGYNRGIQNINNLTRPITTDCMSCKKTFNMACTPMTVYITVPLVYFTLYCCSNSSVLLSISLYIHVSYHC